MDSEMIERCELAINKLQDTGEVIGVKQVVIEVIKAMREPTEKMKNHDGIYNNCCTCGGRTEGYQKMIDIVLGNKLND